MSRNNGDARRCSYFELGLPVVQRDQQRFDRSLRTADVSPRSSPLRDVSLLLAKRPSAAMSEKKRLPFAGYFDRRQEFSLFPLPSSPLDQGPGHRLPRTSVGAFHLAYMKRFLRLTKWWRWQSELEGIDSMSQIKGDITGRTSKERYEQLILEL